MRSSPLVGGSFAARRRRVQGALTLCEVEVAPGTSKEIELPIARLPSGSWVSMPIVAIHGDEPGPTIWFSATIHGDELNGVEIVRRVIADLDPTRLRGTVLAVPIVNVFGVTAGSRYLPDRRDLNRSFPGSLRGSLASRLARLFFDNVASACDLGVDFHTGSGGRRNLPQIRCDLDDAKTRRFALKFGAPVVLHSNIRDGSLRGAARLEGIRILLYEAGEANRFDRASIETGVAGAFRIMAALKMIDARVAKIERPVISRKSSWLRAGRSGFCHLEVELGERVVAKQVIARITDSVGRDAAMVRATSSGVVIGSLQTALVHRGDAIVHLAQPEPD